MLSSRLASWAAIFLFACGDSGTGAGGAGGAGGGGAGGTEEGGSGGEPPEPIVTVLHPDQPPLPGETDCTVTITTNLPNDGQMHHDVCTPLEYNTNPPSSGDHWAIWAQYRTYITTPPREMLVHNLEHGSIVMLFDCPEGCTDVVDAFEQAADDFGVDQLCLMGEGNAERSRIIIAPDPELDEPIGIAAWRATYVATCIDPESIADFIEEHYAKGPENLCREGRDPDDPATGVLLCP